ncbi:MAG: hypothetical protein HY824_02310 [Acidobacteria bacterium]|nr:hypothetical protein [Acidobacteriota bacterium]
MSAHHSRWYIAASWTSLALLAFFATGASSSSSVLVLAVIGLVPPIIMMMLWKSPSPTIAEVLRATEEGR